MGSRLHRRPRSRRGGGDNDNDRLSKLGDATLGHVLSFLPADEAARAALLSRRWRHVLAHVHTVSLDEPEPEPDDDDYSPSSPGWGPCRNCAFKDRVTTFVNGVSAALLGRLRRAGVVPLRALRVGFYQFSKEMMIPGMVDMWLSYAVQQAAGGDGLGLHLDLRLRRDLPVCNRRYTLCDDPPAFASTDDDEANLYEYRTSCRNGGYVTPRSVFTCAALRTLRLGYCRLDDDDDAVAVALMPSLETLHLTGVTGGDGGAVQRLVSSCPRLAALTLEACDEVTALSVPRAARLRTLALRCCHDLASVVVADASELRVFEYRGAVPAGRPSFLTLVHGGPLKVVSCTLDFCGGEAVELDGLRNLLRLFVGVERLHLTSARLGCGAASLLQPAFPAFAKLRHLELTGMLPEDDATAIDAVTRILERTPNLETLSLFFMPEPEPEPEPKHKRYGHHEEELLQGHSLKYDERATLAVPETELPCLRERIKEINFVHYQGAMAQRMLAKFLLCNAPDVQEVCGEFANGPLFVQIKLMEEIKGWVMNKSANMMFFKSRDIYYFPPKHPHKDYDR